MPKDKFIILILTTFLVIGAFIPVIHGSEFNNQIKEKIIIRCEKLPLNQGDGNTEYYAIIATCGRYDDPGANLPLGFTQQRYLYYSLLNAPNWNAKNIIFLVNDFSDINQRDDYIGGATKNNILKAIDEIASKADEDDVFLFAWQGHGSRVIDDDGDEKSILKPFDYYDEVICPYDCYRDVKNNLQNYIRDDELDEKFSEIKAKGMCLIFESCFSGGLIQKDIIEVFDENNNSIIDPEEAESFSIDLSYDLKESNIKDLDKSNRIVIMASLDDCVARLAPILGGPLTTSMALSFLGDYKGNEKDKNNNNFISVEEAFKWAQPRAFCITSGYYLGMWLYSIGMQYFSQNNSNITNPVFNAFINGSKLFFGQFLYIEIITRIAHGVWAATIPHINDNYEGIGGLDIIQLKEKSNEEKDIFSTISFPDEIFTKKPTIEDWNSICNYLKNNTAFDEWNNSQILKWLPSKDDFLNLDLNDINPDFLPGVFASIKGDNAAEENEEIQLSAEILGGSAPYTVEWDFGDNTSSQGFNTSHIYENKGTYIVTLKVIDKNNKLALDLSNPIEIPQKEIIIKNDRNKEIQHKYEINDIIQFSPFIHKFYQFFSIFRAKVK